MDRIGVREQVSHERMARFVVGDGLARIFVEHPAFALGTSDHALHAFGDFLLGDDVLVATRRKDSRFVEQVRQIGTGEARGDLSQTWQVDVLCKRLVLPHGP